jgi:hypothetical protein
MGSVDGEVCERIWSYMGRFASVTKEMSSSTRICLLEDAMHTTWTRSLINLMKLKKKVMIVNMKITQLRASLHQGKHIVL